MSKDANKIKVISEDVYSESIEIGNMGNSISKIEDDISNLAKLSNSIFYESDFRMDNDAFTNVMDNAISAHINWVNTLQDMANKMQIQQIGRAHV